jgi:RNA polymerase sigma-70 factor (ECF subfamily)
VEIYGPLVYEYGRRHGLQDADAADLTQEVLRAVARSAGEFRYDPGRGSFRSWLFTVSRTKRINLGVKGARQPRGSGASDVIEQLNQIPDRAAHESESALWDRAFEQRLLDWAAERIRGEFKESTWRAFALTALEGASPQSVAAELGITIGAVYAARYRVLARLRETIGQARFDSVDV